MSLYMLHTDVVTDLIQARSPALDRRIARTTPHELCISAVTRGELLCGLSRQMPARKAIVAEEGGDAPDSDPDDVIMARPSASPIDRTTMESLRKTTHAALAALTPHEAKVLRKRFGIDLWIDQEIEMGTKHTLESVQRQFDVTRERLRLEEQAAQLSTVLDQFLTRVPCLPWDAEAATHFARIAVDLHRSGAPIGSMDTMIAGHAIAVRAVLVTRNDRHFARITGLKTENWTQG